MSLPLSYSLRSLWARRTTSIVTALGIAMVVFVLSASLMLAAGLRETLLNAGREDRAVVLQRDAFSESGSRMRQTATNFVASAPGVRKSKGDIPLVAAEAVVHVYLGHVDNPNQHASVQIRGIREIAFEMRPEVRVVAGRLPKPGSSEAIVGRALVGHYEGVMLGGGFELQKNRRVQIVGVFEADGAAYESEVWTDIDVVRSAFNTQGYISSVTAQLDSPQALDAFEASVTEDPRRGLAVMRETSYYENVSNNLARVISGLGGIVTFIFSFGALLGAMITMHVSVSQRRREIGVMRALGFQRSHILLTLVLESTCVAFVGGAAGLGAALLMAFVEISTVNWATSQELAFGFAPSAPIIATALASGVVVGLLGGAVPAFRAAKVDPATAMRI